MKHHLFFLLAFSLFLALPAHAQSFKSDSLFLPSDIRQFQFNLEKPAVKITDLKYEKTGEPIKGGLTRDGSRVLLDNYRKGNRVQVTVTYADGSTEVISRSPCFIDPVVFEL